LTAGDPLLLATAQEFADEVAEVLTGTVVDEVMIVAHVHGDRVTIGPVNEQGLNCLVTLPVADNATVRLDISYSCAWDSAGRYLMVERSKIAVHIAHLGEPLIRFEYLRNRSYADAHVQVHAESGALGMHLGAIGWKKRPKLQDLHLPVGGKRYRVTLEDVIEFIVEDLEVPPKSGWRDVIAASRAEWYARQLGAAVRSDQATAVATLLDLGYTVTARHVPRPARRAVTVASDRECRRARALIVG
jgi:hypothetical protein